jgi:hypothetical protein
MILFLARTTQWTGHVNMETISVSRSGQITDIRLRILKYKLHAECLTVQISIQERR